MGTQTTTPGGGAPTPGQTSAANAYQALFNTAYYASKAPAFQPLFSGRAGAQMYAAQPLTQDQVNTLIAQLLAQGYIIDEEIDFLGMDPYTIMYCRQQYGNTWVPAGLGDVPAQTEPPVTYSGPVPAGAIKVSTMISDYPPYPVSAPTEPVTPPIPQAANPVGIRIIAQVPSQPNYIGDVFRCAVANDGYALGATWAGISGAFSGTWTKQALELGLMTVWTKTA
ncbi:MAG TPA: hypothetical protein VMT15_15785 [Bryobacteraceae bacterium]|nr:hypothetical protein [Bryobacteraceae bacterium]